MYWARPADTVIYVPPIEEQRRAAQFAMTMERAIIGKRQLLESLMTWLTKYRLSFMKSLINVHDPRERQAEEWESR